MIGLRRPASQRRSAGSIVGAKTSKFGKRSGFKGLRVRRNCQGDEGIDTRYFNLSPGIPQSLNALLLGKSHDISRSDAIGRKPSFIHLQGIEDRSGRGVGL
jgi:hypothetical protein